MGKYANNIEVIKKPNKMLNKTLSNSAIMNFKSKLISSHSLTNFNDLLIEWNYEIMKLWNYKISTLFFMFYVLCFIFYFLFFKLFNIFIIIRDILNNNS